MEFTDEKIQKMKKEANRNESQDISHMVKMDNEEFHFSRQMMFQEKVSILFPEEFIFMPPNIAKQKYPMEDRPQIIKTNPELTVNFAFSLLPQQLKPEQTNEATNAFHSLIKRMQPANRFFDKKVGETDSSPIGWFDFKSPGLDEPVYTIMAFTSIDNHLLHCIFNSAYRHMESWKPIALQVFYSIQPVPREKY